MYFNNTILANIITTINDFPIYIAMEQFIMNHLIWPKILMQMTGKKESQTPINFKKNYIAYPLWPVT